MKLKFMFAALLAVASFSAMAGDRTVTAIADGNTHDFGSVIGDGILSGGEDVISFAGLAAGSYDISVTLSGQKLVFDDTKSNLNGTLGASTAIGKLQFFGVEYTGSAPFTLQLFGTPSAGANYSGTYSITAVPEPESYGMLLGGLGLLGLVARRKAKKAA